MNTKITSENPKSEYSLQNYMYVCMYVCIDVFNDICVCVCMRVCVHAYMRACVYNIANRYIKCTDRCTCCIHQITCRCETTDRANIEYS